MMFSIVFFCMQILRQRMRESKLRLYYSFTCLFVLVDPFYEVNLFYLLNFIVQSLFHKEYQTTSTMFCKRTIQNTSFQNNEKNPIGVVYCFPIEEKVAFYEVIASVDDRKIVVQFKEKQKKRK